MKDGKCCAICKVVGLLVGIGALNWGFVGLWRMDLVAKFLGDMTKPARIVYILIGLAGLLKLISLVKCCPCAKGSCATKS